MMTVYKNKIDKIKASEKFKKETLQKLERHEKERRYSMNKFKIAAIALAACMILAVGITTFDFTEPLITEIEIAEIDITKRIVIDPDAPSACVAVNIEGTIVEVSKDGWSFKLDSGKWIHVTDETEIGVTLPTAAAIEDQFLEPSFRVGNMISGFAENSDGDDIDAYAIYTNWNWDDPIR